MAAPLAHCDDEWKDFNDFKKGSDQGVTKKPVVMIFDEASEVLEDLTELNNSFSGEICCFKSMEDLVNDFDDKLSVCFQNYNSKTNIIAPVNILSEDALLKTDVIWNVLTDNYGNVMPVDWKQSRTRSLHVPTLNLEETSGLGDVTAEQSDDEELREQLDMHSIIVSCLSDEPLFTAEQVIEEIEEMMQNSPDLEAEQNPLQSDLSMLPLDTHGSNTSDSYEESIRTLSVAELNERLEEVEMTIRRFSEELIQHLALRDELDFEKEVKNSFISVLIDVQNRQKEHREQLKKKKKLKSGAAAPQGRSGRSHTLGTRFSIEGLSTAIQNGFRQTFGSGGGERQYLTTVIPYEKKGGPPSVEDLQVLTNILQAMKDNSDKVPSLLTDYILKVLCPTQTDDPKHLGYP